MTVFIRRCLTGAIFVLFMISMIYWNIWSLSVLLLLILISATDEFLNLINLSGTILIRRVVIFSSAFVFLGVFLVRVQILSGIFILYGILTAITFAAITLNRISSNFLQDFIKIIFSYIYLVLPLSLTLFMVAFGNHSSYNGKPLIAVFVLIWTYDSFAYITGILFGKHKILPSVSPKKSWEGMIGGLLFTLTVACLISFRLPHYLNGNWIIVSLIVVIAGTTGDFFESFLKRKAGVKDSGNWLPGHGGILDRFDSFLFIIPVIFIYLKYLI